MNAAILVKLTIAVALLGGIYAILHRIDQEAHPAPANAAMQEKAQRQSAAAMTGWGKAFAKAK